MTAMFIPIFFLQLKVVKGGMNRTFAFYSVSGDSVFCMRGSQPYMSDINHERSEHRGSSHSGILRPALWRHQPHGCEHLWDYCLDVLLHGRQDSRRRSLFHHFLRVVLWIRQVPRQSLCF